MLVNLGTADEEVIAPRRCPADSGSKVLDLIKSDQFRSGTRRVGSPNSQVAQLGEVDHAQRAMTHRDKRPNYCYPVFEQRPRCAGLLGSMGTVSDALDNVVSESFWHRCAGTSEPAHLTNPVRTQTSDDPVIEGQYHPTRRNPSRLPKSPRLQDLHRGIIRQSTRRPGGDQSTPPFGQSCCPEESQRGRPCASLSC